MGRDNGPMEKRRARYLLPILPNSRNETVNITPSECVGKVFSSGKPSLVLEIVCRHLKEVEVFSAWVSLVLARRSRPLLDRPRSVVVLLVLPDLLQIPNYQHTSLVLYIDYGRHHTYLEVSP